MIAFLGKVRWGRLIVPLALIAYFGSGIYTVERDEEGVVLLFGKPWKRHVPPGMHFAPPWPMGKRAVVRTNSTHQMSVGFKIADMVQGREATPEQSEFMTGDTNIITVEMILQYLIDDPYNLLYAVDDPHFLVRRAAEATVTSLLAKTTVDDALTTGRAVFLEQARLGTMEKLRSYSAGISVVSATLKKIEPPSEVIDAFQDVQNAKADRERTINEARGYANETLPRARGESVAAISAAEADRMRYVEVASGDASRLEKLIAEYRLEPRGVRDRLYLEVMEKVLGKATIYVVDGEEGKEPMGLKLID